MSTRAIYRPFFSLLAYKVSNYSLEQHFIIENKPIPDGFFCLNSNSAVPGFISVEDLNAACEKRPKQEQRRWDGVLMWIN